MLVSAQQSIDLAAKSKPVKDSLKINYGVSYREDINDGGSANVRLAGESYYASPGRNMRRDELKRRQKGERASIVQDY